MSGPSRQSRRGDAQLVQDILDAIARIDEYCPRLPGPGPGGDDGGMVGDAIKYNLVVIGEAVGNLSTGSREREPSIPWTQIKGLRNLLAHQYMHVRLAIIREILAEHLPSLQKAAERLRDAGL